MEYLQYLTKVAYKEIHKQLVLNLVINGIPSIHNRDLMKMEVEF